MFKLTPAGTLTTLHVFEYADGAEPFGGLVQATDGTFMGRRTRAAISCAIEPSISQAAAPSTVSRSASARLSPWKKIL